MTEQFSKELKKKIISCKALQGKTVHEICEMPKFRDNLAAYLTAQREDRKAVRASYDAMRKMGGAKGYKLPSHPIDRVMGMSVEAFAAEFVAIVYRLSRLSAAERQYVFQLGRQAYNLTIMQIVADEFPEADAELFAGLKSKTN